MEITCTRKIEWCAGHRVYKHEGKCAYPHGHQYSALITARQIPQIGKEVGVDSLGRVVDFSVLKTVYQNWVDAYWDHGFLIYEKDDELRLAFKAVPGARVAELPFNPTAENIARFLLTYSPFVQALAQYGVQVTEVEVFETPKCSASAKLTEEAD